MAKVGGLGAQRCRATDYRMLDNVRARGQHMWDEGRLGVPVRQLDEGKAKDCMRGRAGALQRAWRAGQGRGGGT